MLRLAKRVRLVMGPRTLLSLPNPFQRLCVLLLQLPQQVVNGCIEIDQSPTHQELAIMINASRETVTRSFQALILRQAIERQGDHLHLLDTQFLSDVGNGRVEPPK